MQKKIIYGSFTDPRDGQTYKTVKIGDLEWLAENFRYECEGSFVYENDNKNLEKYGRLYTWDAAMKIAPPGWHLPDRGEWSFLGDYVSTQTNIPTPSNLPNIFSSNGKSLMSKSWTFTSYRKKISGIDLFGFNALPAGKRWEKGKFDKIGEKCLFWSSSEAREDSNCAHVGLLYSETFDDYFATKKEALSVRLIRDYTVIAQNREHLEELLEEAFRKRGDGCNLNFIDVSKITDMNNLFCIFDYNADISKWNTKNVTNMSSMFRYSDFEGDISNWDTSNVTNMENMFEDAIFNGDISKWNTKKVTNMNWMFYHADFEGDISNWDVSNVKNHKEIFTYCPIEDSNKPHFS